MLPFGVFFLKFSREFVVGAHSLLANTRLSLRQKSFVQIGAAAVTQGCSELANVIATI